MIWWRWDEKEKCWRPTLVPPAAAIDVGAMARLIPAGTRRWALLASGGVTVNGRPCLPMEILEDRDEVCVAGERYSFGALSPPEVITIGGDDRRIRCARCLDRLRDGDPVVRCPRCRAHHHASCWRYDVHCQKCECPTDGALWTPDSLN